MARKVLLVWELGGNLGHLGRLLPVAQALRQRGVEVEFAVADGAAAAKYLEPAGFRCTTVVAPARPVGETQALNHADVFLRCGFGLPVESLAAQVGQWQGFFSAGGFDAAVMDSSPLALLAARSAGLHAIALGHGFEIPLPGAPGPCFAPWVPGVAESAREREQWLGEVFDRLATALGQAGAPRNLAQLFPAAQSALCAWPDLDHFARPTGAGQAPYIGPIWSQLPGASPCAFRFAAA